MQKDGLNPKNSVLLLSNKYSKLLKTVSFSFTFILLLVICSISCKGIGIRSTNINSHPYIHLKNVANFYGMELKRYEDTCYLKSRYSEVKLNYDSKKGEINNTTVYFSYPIRTRNNKIFISKEDFLLLLEPILRRSTLTKQEVNTIVIDPGHGGKDPGAKGSFSKEKSITLSIGKKLSKILNRRGFQTILTRNTDKFLPLYKRPAICENYNGDMFISLHCNASQKASVSGIETFILSPQNTPSTYGGNSSKKHFGNKNNKNNMKLGYEIQKQLNKTGQHDRGVKHARFAVLKYCSKPSALIELGFISSLKEEKLLNSSKYQYHLAKLIAKGIMKYQKAVQ